MKTRYFVEYYDKAGMRQEWTNVADSFGHMAYLFMYALINGKMYEEKDILKITRGSHSRKEAKGKKPTPVYLYSIGYVRCGVCGTFYLEADHKHCPTCRYIELSNILKRIVNGEDE
jgi:rubrerythrin